MLPVIMAGAALLSAGMGIAGAVNAGNAARRQSRFEAAQAKRNQELAALAGADAVRRGEAEGALLRLRAGQTVGAQRAAYGASGLDVNSGSAAQAQADARMMGEFDAMTARNNAAREAWGYKVQASQHGAQSQLYLERGRQAYAGSILTAGGYALQGLGGVADAYRRYR